jgi:ankyrin repeat protein
VLYREDIMLQNHGVRKDVFEWDQLLKDPSTTPLMKMIYECDNFIELTFINDVKKILEHINDLTIEDLNKANYKGLTALHFAAYKRNPFALTELISKGANLSPRDDFSWTPIHYAILAGLAGQIVLTHLIQAEADLEVASLDGERPLDLALRLGNIEAARLLLDAGASLNRAPGQQLPLQGAIRSKDMEIFKRILAGTTNINAATADGNTGLHTAIMNDNNEAAILLLQNGANPNLPNTDGYTPLHTAVIAENAIIVKALLDHGANPDAIAHDQRRPLYIAIQDSLTDIVRLLVVQGKADLMFDTDKEKHSPLFMAVYINESPEIVQIILENLPLDKKKQVINARDVSSKTALHYACYLGNTAIIKLLIDHGANTELKDNEQGTILHGAAKSGGLEKMAFLLAHTKVDLINEKNCENENALYVAVAFKHFGVAELLIKHKADVNIRTKNDSGTMTPLMKAASNNDEKIVELLVNNGANVNPITKYTPLWYAIDNKNANMVHFLLLKGAQVTQETIDYAKKREPSVFTVIARHQEVNDCIRNLRAKKIDVSGELENQALIKGTEVLQPLLQALRDKEEKQRIKKKAEIVPTPLTVEQEAALKEAEEKKKAEEQKRVAEQLEKKKQEEEARKLEAQKKQEEKTRIETEVKNLSNQIYDFYAIHQETEKAFTRRVRANTIASMIRSHSEPNKEEIARSMLKELGFLKDKSLRDLVKAFTDQSPQESTPREPTDVVEEKTPVQNNNNKNNNNNNNNEERLAQMALNKRLYLQEKEAEAQRMKAKARASSATSSGTYPKIGMRTQEQANMVKNKVRELADIAEAYFPGSVPGSAQQAKPHHKSLRELKYDLIKMAALIEYISKEGAKALFDAIFKDANEVTVIRNGVLHLVSIHSAHEDYSSEDIDAFSHQFYLTILERLSVLIHLRTGLDKGLNSVLTTITERSDLFPISIQDSFVSMGYSELAQETYLKFCAHNTVIQLCSDAKDKISGLQIEMGERMRTGTASENELRMITLEIAELYRQGSNTGVNFSYYPKDLIEHRNLFAHEGIDIPRAAIDNTLLRISSQSPK